MGDDNDAVLPPRATDTITVHESLNVNMEKEYETSAEARADRSISLPVLGDTAAKGARPIRASKSGPRRAAVLILVHVIFAVHLAHWWTTGSTITPVEPSESMRTLELGEINAGAIFFAAAILATLVFGRFFCGWGCHIVALQDLCGWMMKKCGVRPKPFRSRLLMFVPLVLAIYMFLWPTIKRVVIGPALVGVWPEVYADLGITPFPVDGFSNHLVTEGFWDTFASVGVAIPFLFICGFATVYFLGAKGFCTYGCPYGGFFAPADLVAPGKIVVDHDKCHQCGHCTAVCTSNVRVHEEIREYGSVVDPGCMKCMDCVSVCPNGALSFGFTKPTLFKGAAKNKKPRKVFDTSRGEDLMLAAVFIAVFFAFRGVYGLTPMLMAVGMAGCAVFLVWKGSRLFVDRDVRFSIFQFKRMGTIQRAGWALLLLLGVGTIATAMTGYVNYHTWRSARETESLQIAKQALLVPGQLPLPAETVTGAKGALEHAERAAGWTEGGWGVFTPPSLRARLALLKLATGDRDGAETELEKIVESGRADDELVADYGRILRLNGKMDQALTVYRDRLTSHPDSWAVREEWALMQLQRGSLAEAITEGESALTKLPPERFTATAHARTRLTLGRLYAAAGRMSDAMEQLRQAVEVRPKDPVLLENLAAAQFQGERNLPAAIETMQRAVEADKTNIPRRFQLGRLQLQAGQFEDAAATWREAVRRAPKDAELRAAAGAMLMQSGRGDLAKEFAAAAP